MTLPGKPAGVSQTSFIFASVFVAYLVYITLRGDLAKWLGVFGFGAYTPAAAAPAQPISLPGQTMNTPGGTIPAPNYQAPGSALPQAYAPPGG